MLISINKRDFSLIGYEFYEKRFQSVFFVTYGKTIKLPSLRMF